jgi:adenylate cyclase
VEKDPAYALAYAGLADSYVLLGWNSYLPPKEAFPKGKIAAMTALRLDPDLAEAHAPLAALLWLHDWQWEEAEAEFKRSLDLGTHIRNCQSLVRGVCDDHGATRGSHVQDEEGPRA